MCKRKFRPLARKEGLATIEFSAFLILFVAMTGFLFGFWGILHSAILNNIGGRAYAYETFRHRSHLQYFRIVSSEQKQRYTHGYRLHSVVHGQGDNQHYAPSQHISINLGLISQATRKPNSDFHNTIMYQDILTKVRYGEQGVNPVWSKVAYGLCLHPRCGDE